jgi:hypothetical protein
MEAVPKSVATPSDELTGFDLCVQLVELETMGG